MLTKIDKKLARKFYNVGIAIKILPCKINPNSQWYGGGWYDKSITYGRDFDKLVNDYTYYNCNSETGRYCAYYFEEVTE